MKRNRLPEKSRLVLFLLSSGSDEESMRCISKHLLERDASYKVKGLAIERHQPGDGETVLNIWNYSNRNPVEVLRSLNPCVMVTGDDSGIPYRAFVEAAKFLNIPTLLLVSGVTGRIPFSAENLRGGLWLARNWRSTLKRSQLLWVSLRSSRHSPLRAALFIARLFASKFYHTYLYGKSRCSQIAVPGDYARNLFIEQGVPSESIVITGQPRFDDIPSKSFDRDAFRKQLKLTSDKPLVSLLTDAQVEHRLWTKHRRRDFISKVLASFSKLPEVQFVIKIHPYEDPTEYERAVREKGWDIPVSRDIPLHELINASDAVITGISTTGLETLIFNKLLITLNFYNQAEYIPYVSEGVAIGVDKANELPSAIRKVLHDPQMKEKTARKRENFLHQHLYLQDGKASQRVADLITLMISTQSPIAKSKLATAASQEA